MDISPFPTLMHYYDDGASHQHDERKEARGNLFLFGTEAPPHGLVWPHRHTAWQVVWGLARPEVQAQLVPFHRAV